ncbi:hypothetical protein N9N67_03630 [Bacteriovoracaceae bacterium]|nr:hypothetical protein [Bacteriovoracaceae bacterium]
MDSKKFILILTLTFLLNIQAKNDGELVQFKHGQIHGLVSFVEAISGYQHGSKSLVKSFKGTKYDNAKANTELGHVKEILSTLPSYEYDKYPKARHIGANLRELIIGQSIFATSLSDFSNRIISLLPKHKHARLMEVLKKYDPIYKELVWNKTNKELQSFVQGMRKSVNWEATNSHYSKIINFYQSKWPREDNFTIGVYPVDCEKGSVTAESLVNVQTMGVCVHSKKYLKKWDIAIHEMSHTLYQNQSEIFQNKVESYFRSSTSKYAYKAYFYFNEVLATSIGNGWFHQQVNGKLNNKDWYNNKYINTMAKAMLPSVSDYMRKKQSLDRLFIKKYINLFAEKFPNSIYEYKSIFSNMIVFSDSTYYNQYDIRNAVENHFTIRSWSIFDDLKEHEIKNKVDESLGETVIFVLGDSKQDRYKNMINDIDLLRARKDKIKKMDKHLLEVNPKGKAILILKSLNVLELNKLFKELYKEKKVKL